MTTCPCGAPVTETGPSLDYCSMTCQYHYMGQGLDALPVPARPEWRMGQHPESRIVPHPDGGVTMPAQETAEPPRCGAYASEHHRSTADGGCPRPAGHEGAHALTPQIAVDAPPEQTSKKGMLARLRGAMKGTS
ncbi:hypothetical protein GCM10027447_12570 [Glycomyces halotolerans]